MTGHAALFVLPLRVARGTDLPRNREKIGSRGSVITVISPGRRTPDVIGPDDKPGPPDGNVRGVVENGQEAVPGGRRGPLDPTRSVVPKRMARQTTPAGLPVKNRIETGCGSSRGHRGNRCGDVKPPPQEGIGISRRLIVQGESVTIPATMGAPGFGVPPGHGVIIRVSASLQ